MLSKSARHCEQGWQLYLLCDCANSKQAYCRYTGHIFHLKLPRTLPIVLWLFKLGPLQFLNLYVSKLAPYWAIYVAVVYALKCNSVFGKWLKLYFNGSLITHWTAPNKDNNHSFLWGVIPQHITQSSWEIFILDNLISAQHFIIYEALVIKYFRKSKIWSVG